jgi:hypothetical protein
LAIENNRASGGRLLRLEEVPPPEFSVNVASKTFSDSVSGLESTFADCSANVDFKEDAEVSRQWSIEKRRS